MHRRLASTERARVCAESTDIEAGALLDLTSECETAGCIEAHLSRLSLGRRPTNECLSRANPDALRAPAATRLESASAGSERPVSMNRGEANARAELWRDQKAVLSDPSESRKIGGCLVGKSDARASGSVR